MMTPTAPPAAALFILISKLQMPRSTNTTIPLDDPSGNGEQASEVASRLTTSSNGPATAWPGSGPLPVYAGYGVTPSTVTAYANERSLRIAPTEIASGALARFASVVAPGPLFPADTVTITPAFVAAS